MKPAPFDYHAPTTAAELAELLGRLAGDDARILAGGQSLVPMMAFRMAMPRHLIDINGVAGLDGAHVAGGELAIGATVRHAAFERPVEPGPLGRLLAAVARHIGHAPIRARGTFCGSLANADPASEWCLVAATLGARIDLASRRGARVIDIESFLLGIMTTALEPDEFLAGVRLPLLPEGTVFGFHEVCRRAGDFAMAAGLAVLRIENGRIVDPRLGLGGVEATPRRIGAAEAVIAGHPPSPDLFDEAAAIAARTIDPLTDSQTDAALRRDLARAALRRALAAACP